MNLNRIMFCCILFCLWIPVLAEQDPTPIHSSTTVPATARFEIVQSTLAAKWTFKLDRQTGFVYQIVKTKDDSTTWEPMTMDELPAAASSGVHYQLFLSGIVAKLTLLMNTDTGKTWQLQQVANPTTKEVTYAWEPI